MKSRRERSGGWSKGEMRVLRSTTRIGRLWKECIREVAQKRRFRDTVKEMRLRWLEHVRWKDAGYIGNNML